MTSRRSRQTSRFRLVSAVVLFALASTCLADYRSLAERARETQDPKSLARLVRASTQEEFGGDVKTVLSRLENAKPGTNAELAADRLRSLLDLYAIREGAATAHDAARVARQIKSSALYRDPGVNESSNWLGKALERLLNLLRHRERRVPNLNVGGLGPIVTVIMWGLLACGVLSFLYLALRHYNWRAGLRRKAAAVMEEDEPERTADEWLAEAERLETSGDFRRAVRCLYLACLLRFDEARIARFDRGQTNWEHLARIQASGLLPEGLDFQPATRAFDRIWYGRIVRGREDVDQFRAYYNDVKTRVVAAAS